ncbi:MAG: hypothetical protein WEB58_06330 [Planctomycetaceae bacterium]
MDLTNDKVVGVDVLEESPSNDVVWDTICKAICAPAAGDPRRPQGVRLSLGEFDRAWSDRFEEIGIACEFNADESQINTMIDELTERIVGSRRIMALTHIPGITPEMLGSYFEAAAAFFLAAPWRHFPGDVIIRVESGAFNSGPWYAIIMGQHGVELGFAVYENLEQLRTLMSGRLSYEKNAKIMSALSLMYGEMYDISPEDLDAIDQFGWPVATKEAYPAIMRVNPGLALRLPLVWEVELLEALLRALPEFVRQKNSNEFNMTVNTSLREISL